MIDPFLTVLLIVASPAIGSFIGVLVDRLPRGESPVVPGSHCRSCKTRLRWSDLIPIVSFTVSRGACRTCGSPLPKWLLYTEVAAIGLALIAVAPGWSGVQAALAAFILWTLLALVVTDLLWFRLPNPLTLCLFAAAIVWSFFYGDPRLAVTGALIGAGSFFALRIGYKFLRQREGLGLGDVKLMAGLGALTGPLDVPILALIAAVAALVVALFQRTQEVTALHADRAVPFGAYLAGAGGAVWIALHWVL